VSHHLSQEQIAQYRDEGYVFPVPVLSPTQAAEARSHLESHEANSGRPIGPVERSRSHLLFKWVDDIMRSDTILDRVEDLIGPNILCWNTIFWVKEAQSPSYVGWHQDLTYWGLDNAELVNVWIALSPATVAAGCMNVLPRSHLEVFEHDETYAEDNLLTRGQELTIDIAGRNPVAMPLQPGEASIHNVKTAHGSGPNSTDDRRIGLAFQYIPTHTRQTIIDWDSAALVRGVDEYNHFAHCPVPRSDFDPEAVEFHQHASKAMRDIVYAGAKQGEPTL
jgi:non-heme Fe2+,alpha-ketoglutarate-dependent halogenase